MSSSIPSTEWVNSTEYPFEHRYIELKAGTMHYVDEGEGEPILFVHGTPTWSFLYRKFIKSLSNEYRTLAVDHLGFGLSEKSSDFPGRPQAHARNLAEFIHRKKLRDITLVVHDFGGPIGLAAALEDPGRIKRIVLFNTWLWETASNREIQKIDRFINSFLGRLLYLRLNFSPKVMLRKAFHNKKWLTKRLHEQYILPFPDTSSRLSLYRIAQSLAGASGWYGLQWQKLTALEDREWLILWGTEDTFITQEFLDQWRARLPQAEVHEFDCGHFVQEECADEAVTAMSRFFTDPKDTHP